jgi:hypothetical protein
MLLLPRFRPESLQALLRNGFILALISLSAQKTQKTSHLCPKMTENNHPVTFTLVDA